MLSSIMQRRAIIFALLAMGLAGPLQVSAQQLGEDGEIVGDSPIGAYPPGSPSAPSEPKIGAYPPGSPSSPTDLNRVGPSGRDSAIGSVTERDGGATGSSSNGPR